MNLKSIKNNASRNGFDLSFKKNFTAKVGELLPVMLKSVLPGDVFTIDLSAFTRTQPINTAAFARMREYYDFFFVPYNLLWNKADTTLTQMYDNPQHASSIDTSLPYMLNGQMPYITCKDIATYLTYQRALAVSNVYARNNYFGYRRGQLTSKLLEYLGYGNYEIYSDPAGSSTWSSNPTNENLNLNLFGLLAYQKIYADFYRDSQWEKINPSCFNVDYMTGTSTAHLQVPSSLTSSPFMENYNMFDLRYCNWQKDLFHGVLPRQQYGSTAAVPIKSTLTGAANSSEGYRLMGEANGNLDILLLRQYEFLQKWKEVAQSADKSYKDQVAKHWNVKVDDYSSELCTYLGGINSNIDINEVVNTNITGTFAADIAGKGTGVSRGQIRFDSGGKYGVLMCIYHCLPVLDYTTDYVDPSHTNIYATDYPIPEFDKVGMESVPFSWLMNHTKGSIDGFDDVDLRLGYAPRYIAYKTSIDSSVGGFKRDLNGWIMSYDNNSVADAFRASMGEVDRPESGSDTPVMNYTVLKVNPNSVDPIFAVNADSTVNTDQFLCSTFFDVKVVRNLDVDGLPY